MKPVATYQSKEALRKLVQQLAKGDVTAIDILYRLYFKRLKQYGLQIVGSHHSDLVTAVIQEFYMWLVKNHQKMAVIEDFELYLFKSVRLNILSSLKKQEKRDGLFQNHIDITQHTQIQSIPSPEAQFITQENEQLQKDLIRSVLDKLPTYQKEVLYLRYFQNYSYKDIGEILSVSEQVARNYAYRAVKGMKGQLGQNESSSKKSRDLS